MQDWTYLGECIKRDRKKQRWLQADLAEAAGLTKRTIGTYEAGRPPTSAPDIPSGYYAVGAALGWLADGVERALDGKNPKGETRIATAPAVEGQASGASALDLYPAVGRFARAAVAAGGDPALRDLLEEAADRLLQSIPPRQPEPAVQSGYSLAAYRPHAWAEGDSGVPEDDAARIEQALEEYSRGRREEP
ncbi:helix-turn-helix transcriptional regulator [Kitasatospora sp. NPDC058201]|uniref:helix-turn-helix transcriptional regulator n=1 Tax=unclassified Kitasatospora TaxID=2633591 RepID=UPI0036578A68